MATPNPIATGTLVDIDWLQAVDQLLGRDITGGSPGWVSPPNPWVYVSANSFKIVGVDVTNRYTVGTKLSCTDAAATKYFYVVSSAYAASDTTVTITGGSDYTLSGGAITNPRFAFVENPYGFPGSFAFTPGYSGWAATPTMTGFLAARGKTLSLWLSVSGTSTNTVTAVATPFIITQTIAGTIPCRIQDNGGAAVMGLCYVAAASATLTFYKDLGAGAFTASGTKAVWLAASLPI